MKDLKRIRYNTMNSWNRSTAPAYNLKINRVIRPELQNKVFDLMDCEGFYDDINMLIHDFDLEQGYQWQAGFNGRSGGYLVLYRGGKHPDGTVFSYPGKNIEDNEVPGQVLRDFRRLALDIISDTEYNARKCTVKEVDRVTTTKIKIFTPVFA